MYATLDLWLSSLRSLPGDMDETDALRARRYNEDAVSLAPSTTESIIVEGERAGRGRGGVSALLEIDAFVWPAICYLEGVSVVGGVLSATSAILIKRQ